MKMRNQREVQKKMCPNCKGNMEEVKYDAYGKKSKTHFFVSLECHVCGHRSGGKLEEKPNALRTTGI